MRRLYRSASDKKIAGLCGGMGEVYDVDPNLIRLVTILAALLTAVIPLAVTYIVGWIIVPLGAHSPDPQR